MQSELVPLFLNDVTLGGKLEDVLRDLETVKEAADLGLLLHPSKSEVISDYPNIRDSTAARCPCYKPNEGNPTELPHWRFGLHLQHLGW